MSGPLPGFLVIGAMKAGTTSLHHYLAAHPGLHLPTTKELNFFRDDRHFGRGVDWYRRQFAGAAPGQVAGEVSPDYAKHPHWHGVPERAAAVVPGARLVYLVRDPVARMRSMYVHQVAAGVERRPADVALLEEPHYLETSSYALQAERWLERFAPEQLLVCTSEELREDRDAVLARVHRFVGVEPLPAAAPEGTQWYRSEDRRQRRGLLKVAASFPALHGAFARVPAPLREAVRRAGSRELPAGTGALSPATERALRDRLAPDLERFRALAPDAVRRWERAARDREERPAG
ncbi:sulfotransferase domain-containing protein [Vallicoccus soli]|uniref:Sulfotransferase domain-containing protein n=1 Tax=Vallicoccus soli TaxID=2339232 RepID=A0A3A3Z9V9_9ACTN|nr:sulfotransferase domain-containing protein [Vallicoccus soli]RJK97876.1 hypothetical protein D5H78_02585 [Vallicoccus soli]